MQIVATLKIFKILTSLSFILVIRANTSTSGMGPSTRVYDIQKYCAKLLPHLSLWRYAILIVEGEGWLNVTT
jgi:hypothetical protein